MTIKQAERRIKRQKDSKKEFVRKRKRRKEESKRKEKN